MATEAEEIAERVPGGGTFSVEKFVESFPVLVDAAGGSVQLRRMVLGFALSGRLSKSDSNDVPSVALTLSEGRAKGRPPAPVLSVPDSWAYAPVGQLADCVLGKMLDKRKHTKGTLRPYLRNLNVRWFGFDLSDVLEMYFEDDELDRYGARPGDVLICEGGEPGRAAVWSDRSPILIQKAIHRVRFRKGVESRWLVLNLRHDAWSGRLEQYFTGATIKHFTGKSLAEYTIPVPPLAEQKRIVARVDQLMALIDQLEAKQNRKRDLGVRYTKASLEALTTAESPQDFTTAWTRIHQSWPTVLDQPDKACDLKATILDLALSGRLVSQQFEEDALADVRMRKPGMNALDVTDGLFPIPPNWAWVSLSDLVASLTDGDHQPPPQEPSGVPFLTIGNVSGGRLDFTSTRFVSRSYFESLDSRRVPQQGDILYTVVGATYGRPVPVDEHREFCVQRHIAILRPDGTCNRAFLLLFLRSGIAYAQATQAITGTAQPTVPLRPLRAFRVPLPPLAEQEWIVAKVEHLMKLCDALEAALRRREDRSAKLAEAMVQEMVA